jgi:uncharacterized protein YndB with AHSA1/START domain
MNEHVAVAERLIAAPVERVWLALTDTESHSKMMFGATVETDWAVGSPITWAGEWEGKPFTDRGEILEADPPEVLSVTHFSPLSGEPEATGTHVIEWRLTPEGEGTRVRLSQDGNRSPEAAEHSAENWRASLDALAEVVEG